MIIEDEKDRGPALLLIIIYPFHNMYIVRAGGSSVVRPKMSNVPWPVGLLLRLT